VPETSERYAQRLAGYVEGKDFLAMQQEAPGRLQRLVAGVANRQLICRPAPGKWSVVEILAHLAEDELTSSWRYRQMIEHNGVTLMGFDQDQWAELGAYRSWDPAEALAMFQLLREANLRMLKRLDQEQWQCYGVHAERGEITVRGLARHMAGHDINHILQIEKILGETAKASETQTK
jgi:hypothetical protein